jgi:NitT/TauT family transport system substrate-binding protein
LGAFDARRLKGDYELVKAYLGIERPFDIEKTATNEFLDQSIKMPRE